MPDKTLTLTAREADHLRRLLEELEESACCNGADPDPTLGSIAGKVHACSQTEPAPTAGLEAAGAAALVAACDAHATLDPAFDPSAEQLRQSLLAAYAALQAAASALYVEALRQRTA